MTKGIERLVLPGDPEIEVRLRRLPRTRRLSLRVSRMDGRVTLSMPLTMRLAAAEEFLVEKAGWVRGHLSNRPAPTLPVIGSRIPLEGLSREITVSADNRLRVGAGVIEVARSRPVHGQLSALFQTLARDRLVEACDRYSAAIGHRYTRLTLRDTRSRWGSCTSEGRLMFSWRLVMAPPEVLDYVAAHEVAHLAEMNHSAAFWRCVETLCPDYATPRAWLRRNGSQLHQIRFTT